MIRILKEPSPPGLVLLFSAACSLGCASSTETVPMPTGATDSDSITHSGETTEDASDSEKQDSDTTALAATGGDDCEHAIAISLYEGENIHYVGDFNSYSDKLDPKSSGCVGSTGKPEVFFSFTVPAWHVLVVEELGVINTTVHILKSCENLVCLATSDPLGTDSREVFNSTDVPLSIIIAVETNWATRGPFDVSFSLQLRPPGHTCDYAIPVESGGSWTWQASSWEGYEDSFSSGTPTCPALAAMPEAQDIWFSAELPPGNILAARDPRIDPVFGSHEVAILSSCDAASCLAGDGGRTGGTAVLWNESESTRTVSLVLQRSLELTTPPALEVSTAPPKPGAVCATALPVLADQTQAHESGSWSQWLDTGPSSGPGCSLPTPDGGGEDLWLALSIPAHERLVASETVPVHYLSNLSLVADCGAHACLASGRGGLSFKNLADEPLEAFLHIERISAAQTTQYDVVLSIAPPPVGATCDDPLLVSQWPLVLTLPSGLLPYGDDVSLSDDSCGGFATGLPDLLIALDLAAGETVGVALAGGSNIGIAVLGEAGCAGTTCLAFSKTGSLEYTPSLDSRVFVAVEGPYSAKNLVLTVYSTE